MRRLLLPGIGLLILGIGLGMFFFLRPEPPKYVCRDCNVVLILLDTLRADHLGSYGYERDTSPNLDTFARQHVQFLNARSQASCTFPSVNSLLTSQHVFAFTEYESRPAIPESILTLPEILQARGYKTAAVSASPIVRSTPGKHNQQGGFGRGFEDFDESCEWRRAECVRRQGLEWLEELVPAPPASPAVSDSDTEAADPGAVPAPQDEPREPPFFLYLHYLDPHDPYVPHRKILGRYSSPYGGEHEFIRDGDPNPLQQLIREGRVEEVVTREDIDHLVDLYDEEIYYLDGDLQKLFDRFEALGILDRTIVIIASDHGEAFYEHGQFKHCFTVFDEEIRVPLLLRIPGLDEAMVRSAAVQNLDIVPTILDYLGFEDESWTFAGTSLRSMIESPVEDDFESHAYSSINVYRSVNDARHKLVWHLGKDDYQLFDLSADPGESRNMLADRRRIFRDLRTKLAEWLAASEGQDDLEQRIRRAEEIEEELRAVGYLG